MVAQTAWADLPNARHIDWVVQSLRESPQLWDAAWNAARDAAWGAACSAARNAARDDARDDAWYAAGGAAWGAARDDAWNAAWDAAYDAVTALVAWDDASRWFDVHWTSAAMQAEHNHAALLMLPAAMIYQGEVR